MKTKVSSTNRARMRPGRPLIWDGPVLIVVAWFLTSCVSVQAQDLKLVREHAQTSAQQNEPGTDEKARIANGADAASCVVKSDNLATKPDEAASTGERDNQGRMSNPSNEAASGETLTLQVPSQEEWGKDQIHLGAETNLREESRGEKSENSSAGSDLKCTPHEAAPKTKPALRN